MRLNFKIGMFVVGFVLVGLMTAGTGRADSGNLEPADDLDASSERMSWLLNRDGREAMALTGQRFEQSEIGGGGGGSIAAPDSAVQGSQKKKKNGWPVLFSLILPGAGEASMGYTRGYFMMALDIFAWTQVAKYSSDGDQLTDDYLAYADAHYTDEMLLEGYLDGGTDIERGGEGAIYFTTITSNNNFNTLDDLNNLPLYVSKEDDFREYYENLGKWDQFIFGWDDYTRASIPYAEYDYEPTLTRADLQQPWVSKNRETYRLMRDEANDAYGNRDTWLYVNIGLRVFSVIQSAYLGGLLGGGPDEDMEVAGHTLKIYAQPVGFRHGAVAATVSF